MEQKKSPQADLEQQRTTGFLLGLVLVLALFFVALEWNSVPSSDDMVTLDLDELVHEDEMIPMSIDDTDVNRRATRSTRARKATG